jgi:hypothetical protein
MHSKKAATILALLTLLVAAPLASGQERKPDGGERSAIAGRPPNSAGSPGVRENQQQAEAAKPARPSSLPSSRLSSSHGKTTRAARKRGLSLRSDSSVEPSVVAPITLVSRSPEYLSGEANVTVKANENPIIRLGLARSGVTLVEFPASDRFFALHPGDSEMVTIDESPTKQNDHFFVFRAGSNFVPSLAPNDSEGPSASIIVQMRSGMVVTFLIYPVRELSQMAHRIVILYDRADVLAWRRAAGLAVNLAERQDQQQQRSIRIAGEPEAPSAATDAGSEGDAPQLRPRTVEPRQVSAGVDGRTDSANTSARVAAKTNPDLDLEAQARKTLKLAITSTKFKGWSRPIHGLSVASSTPKEIGDGQAIVVLAVSNILPEPLRIVPGQPELAIETRDDKGKTLLVERIKALHVESSGMDNSIPAGATLYYAIVYQRPVLGVRQHVRVFVGQINAADDPAVADVSASTR